MSRERKLLFTLIVILGLLLAVATKPEASPEPAWCQTYRCINQ